MLLLMLLIYLLMNTQEVVQSTTNALTFFVKTLFPVLLPYTIMANLFLHRMNRIHNSKIKIGSCILLGYLCGFPMGTITTRYFYQNKAITKAQANLLLSFTNLFSPAFLGSVLLPLLAVNNKIPFYLGIYGIPSCYGLCLYLKQLLYNQINNPLQIKTINQLPSNQNKPFRQIINSTFMRIKKVISLQKNNTFLLSSENLPSFQIFSESIYQSFETMCKLCGCIVVCQILGSMFCQLLPNGAPYLIPLTELNSGLTFFQKLTIPWVLSYVSFGGLCSYLQVAGILSDTDLSLNQYCCHKIMQAIFTYIFFYLGTKLYPQVFC